MSEPAIKVRGLHKSYRMGSEKLEVLRGVSFSMQAGEFAAIVGASGSGKSTLLHLVGLLDKPDSGTVLFEGVDTGKLSPMRRNRIRCRDVGFVFQFYHLLPELNVLENVLLPAKVDSSLAGWFARRWGARARAIETLEKIGLKERLKHRPRELSGGERQRVAIARALMNRPKVLLADEPTGNLDSTIGQQILDVLKGFNKAGQTILMVTHDAALAAQTHRILHLRDGRLAE
ncbi:MAG: ABC transporter ATP-binding protein [Phycisphaerae bacterium]